MKCLVRAALVLLACSNATPASFQVRESVGQLQITHAPTDATLEVVDARGQAVVTGVADAQGSFIFRGLAAGDYRVRVAGTTEQTGPLHVLSLEESQPTAEQYAEQVLEPGFNYLRMRDGTLLSAWVTLPGSTSGSWPTVVNYSGYAASKPGTAIAGYDFLCGEFPIVCAPPDDGSALIAGMLGYATVSVNLRGTGCSGGAYDFFETLQLLDGYDVIQIVAAQRWARHHQVGMIGLSYPGITQLFVGAQRPPGLAAIAPQSVIGNTTATLLPGGILNEGFALAWVQAVVSRAVPYGQGWEQARVDSGDAQCAENQLLHSQMVDNVAQARVTRFYEPSFHDRFNPTTFVSKIDVPVYLTGAWQDEQVGPYFFTLFDQLPDTPQVKITTRNGMHVDAFAPDMIMDLYEFLELYVGRRVPVDPVRLRNYSPYLFDTVFKAKTVLPPARFSGFSSLEEARAAWEAQPRLRHVLESGAGDASDPGAPVGRSVRGYSAFPPREVQPLRLYLSPGGGLGAAAPTASESSSRFRLDPEAGATGTLPPEEDGPVTDKLPPYDWRAPAPGDAVVFVSARLDEDLELYGTASVDLWLQSPVDDADLEVTLSELRSDGIETYVQTGQLRASHRAPGPRATELWPAQTFEQAAWRPLEPGVWTQVRIGTAGIGHVFRQGSAIVLTVDTPGGTRPAWRFSLLPFPTEVRYLVGHDAQHPSSVVLPRIPGGRAEGGLPVCPSLRGQPCRPFTPSVNDSVGN